MRPALLLLALVSLPLALAAPLLGSLGSVAEGGYCRAYGCTLVERRAIAPDLLDKVSHTYALRGGGSLSVLRDHDRRIEAATLTGRPLDGPAARDFMRNFAGVAVEPATLRSCARRATAEGVVVASGSAADTAYAVRCYTYAGRLYLSVERP